MVTIAKGMPDPLIYSPFMQAAKGFVPPDQHGENNFSKLQA
jgi:hypothetical protein